MSKRLTTYVVEFTITFFVKVDGYWESCDVGFQEFYLARSQRGARCLTLLDYSRPKRPNSIEQFKFTRVDALDY